MDFTKHLIALVVILVVNFGINYWYNSSTKDKDNNSIGIFTTLQQSLLSALLAIILLFLSENVLAPKTEA